MKPLILLIMLLLAALAAEAQNTEGELAKVREQELEEVREPSSELKSSMDRSAAARDRLTGKLQSAEAEISEKRIRL